MKFQVTQENLIKPLTAIARIINTNNTLPILNNILIKVTKTNVSLLGTNLEVSITKFIRAKIIEEGSLTVPAVLFTNFISNLPNNVITVESIKNQLKINTENNNGIINGISDEEFPIIPETKKGTVLKINAQEFKQKLQQVVFAASNNESRPVLTGVFLFVKDLKLYLVSTDGSRLSENIINNINKEGSLLVPSSAINNLIKTIADEDEEISIIIDNQQVCFEFNDTKFICRLLEDKYPQYQNLIPKSFTSKARVNKVEFINMVKIANLFAKESARSITIELDPQNQEIKINSLTSQIGENTSKARAEIKGSGQITLNSKFLMEALNSIQGTVVDFCFNSKTEPILIKDTTDRDYTHIIMPLKV